MSVISETRSERINVLVTPTEKAAIEKLAKQGGERVSDYVRRAVLAPPPDDDDLEEAKALAEMVGATAERLHKKLDQGLKDIAKTQRSLKRLRKSAP
ncbi:MAG: hypothetical protein AAGJ73_13070 [Pseudomonadota bacterium]